jgi:hypothetical protein
MRKSSRRRHWKIQRSTFPHRRRHRPVGHPDPEWRHPMILDSPQKLQHRLAEKRENETQMMIFHLLLRLLLLIRHSEMSKHQKGSGRPMAFSPYSHRHTHTTLSIHPSIPHQHPKNKNGGNGQYLVGCPDVSSHSFVDEISDFYFSISARNHYADRSIKANSDFESNIVQSNSFAFLLIKKKLFKNILLKRNLLRTLTCPSWFSQLSVHKHLSVQTLVEALQLQIFLLKEKQNFY